MFCHVMFMMRSNAMYKIQQLMQNFISTLYRHVQEKFKSLSWKFVIEQCGQ